jgi:hypothetical protein
VNQVISIRQGAEHTRGFAPVAGFAQGDAVQCHNCVCADDPRRWPTAPNIERFAAGSRQRLPLSGQLANAALVEGRGRNGEVEPRIFEQLPPSRRGRRQDKGSYRVNLRGAARGHFRLPTPTQPRFQI